MRAKNDTVIVHAHRGFAGVYPENTVHAAERAAPDADFIECDVVPAADGTPVVIHDSDLAGDDRRLTDSEGVVWETPLREVLDADVLGSGKTVPTLAALADAIPSDTGLNIELKHNGGRVRFAESLDTEERTAACEEWRPFVERVANVLDDVGNDVLYSSFDESALTTVCETTDAPVGVLVWNDLDRGFEAAARLDAAAIHPPWNLVSGTRFTGDDYLLAEALVDRDIVADAHDADMKVNAWTVDTWYRAAELADAGVDGLICDYPTLLEY